MPYLPPSVVNETGVPTAYSPYKDLAVTSKLLIEQWERYYPRIDYKMLDLDVRKAVNDIAGNAPHTQIDDLYGEATPQSPNLDKQWHQPHAQDPAGDELDATAGKKYKKSITLNAKVEIVARNRELGDFGIHDDRDLQIAVPTPLLDKVGITVRIGDIFIWDGEVFEVVDWSKEYYWKNTNVFLHVIAYAKRREIGS